MLVPLISKYCNFFKCLIESLLRFVFSAYKYNKVSAKNKGISIIFDFVDNVVEVKVEIEIKSLF